ncbi:MULTISPECIES: hypothetical protein [unclassified Streptomyces]|uniref:hypothetical protein n=1 Tax=unclassified Streptomyces TaxID=2593676 RepID=UPI002E31894F|nr:MULTISPECIES: hypothetical protein [unclassified Streptomyces]
MSGPFSSRLAAGLLSVALFLSASGCASSSRTEADYRLKAANTAEAAASAVATARLAVGAAGHGMATGPYLSVVLGEAEKDLSGVEQAFTSRQPPGEAADRVRDQVEEVLADAGDALAKARIAARRGQITELGTQAGELTKVRERLDRLEEQLS